MGNKNQKKKINWQLTVAICSVVTTLVIGTFAVIYSHNTNKILEEQTKIIHLQSEILKISSQPYEAHIEYLQEKENWHIYAGNFLKSELPNGSVYLSKPYSRLFLYNLGKIDTQWVRCWSHPEQHNAFYAQFKDSYPSYQYDSTGFIFNNIATGTVNLTGFWLSYGECAENIDYCSNISNIPLGQQKTVLSCDCYWCKSQKEFSINITFCVHLNESRDC